MTQREKAMQEICQVPDIFIDEALDFIRYLKTKAITKHLETSIASESSLKKDWLQPEEDIAWQSL